MIVESTEQQDQSSDPIFDKATAAGWKPLDLYDGDPDRWVDAKEFIGRAPLYEQNHKLKKEVSELKGTIHEVKGYISKVSEAAYNKAVADLTAQRDEAIEYGNKEQVRELDKALKEAETLKTPVDNIHPAIKSWEAENGEWFYSDPKISRFGKTIAQNYLDDNPGDIEGALQSMEEAVKKAYPDKAGKSNDKRKDPPAVESGNNGKGKKSFTKSDLDDEQRRVMNKFVRQGVMTEEDYIKELADSGILGGKK